jgi:hypothetical protein
MGEKRFLPIRYRDPILAAMPHLAERGAQVEFGDDGESILSMHPAVRYPDGRVEVVEQVPTEPPPDSSHECLGNELPGGGDLEFVTENVVVAECGSCDLCFLESGSSESISDGARWLRLPVREVHEAFWCPQCLQHIVAAATRSRWREGDRPHLGEPIFQLYARDPLAPTLIRLWAAQRWSEHTDPAVVAEARRCADAMEAWHKEHRS